MLKSDLRCEEFPFPENFILDVLAGRVALRQRQSPLKTDTARSATFKHIRAPALNATAERIG
jgi:hypothetical protein